MLFAGSAGYRNYHNQADVCHADQIQKKGGLKEDNTIVFVDDDIAHTLENSIPGTVMMLIYFICGTTTIRLQSDQIKKESKKQG
jgi:glycosylphosphatidylinositol transamidase (GPIT) subunit GPI8